MRKEIEKPVKAYICVIAGLLLTALFGQPNVITLPVTALLVIGTGQTSSREGLRKYMFRRILVQILDASIMVTTMWLLQNRLPIRTDSWVAVLVTMSLTLPIVMYLDYRLKVSPMYITTVTVSGLVMISGSAKQWNYPLVRILLVMAGCALGYIISLWILPRDRAKSIAPPLRQGTESLLLALEHLLKGDDSHLMEAIQASRVNIQAVDSELIPLLADRAPDLDILYLDGLQRSHKALHQLAVFWSQRNVPVAGDLEWQACLPLYFDLHRKLLARQPAEQIVPSRFFPTNTQDETVLLGALVVYRETLEELRNLSAA